MTDHLLPEQVANSLRREILKGTFMPGQPIKERDQALKLDVSRTPMREAVRILSQEGLITLRAARSPIVANPSFDEVCNVIDVLTTLELRCGILACSNATKREVTKITNLNKKMQSQRGRIDLVDMFELDMAFHMAIAEASHNDVLAQTHHSFIRRLWRARFLSMKHMGNNEVGDAQHIQIVTALQNKDSSLIQEQIALHLKSLPENIRDQYANE